MGLLKEDKDKYLDPSVKPGEDSELPSEIRGRHLSSFAKLAVVFFVFIVGFGLFYGMYVRMERVEQNRVVEESSVGSQVGSVSVGEVRDGEDPFNIGIRGSDEDEDGDGLVIEAEVVKEDVVKVLDAEIDVVVGEYEQLVRDRKRELEIEWLISRFREIEQGRQSSAQVPFSGVRDKSEGVEREQQVSVRREVGEGDGNISYEQDRARFLEGLRDGPGNGDPNRQGEKEKFVQAAKSDVLFGPTPRISRYELKTGWVINAVLETGISSDLPGYVTARVSNNVYDSATGNYLLIPQGSKLFGQYSSMVSYGQSRVLVAWRKIVYPDGRSFDIGKMGGSDPGGYSGLSDRVNNHYFKLFGQVFLLSSFQVLGNTANSERGSESTGANNRFEDIIAANVASTSERLTEKNLAVQPTLEIRPGYQFIIMVNRDLVFSEVYPG